MRKKSKIERLCKLVEKNAEIVSHRKCLTHKENRCDQHPTIYHTVMGLTEWDKWCKHQDILIGFKRTGKLRTFDYTETMECGWMSPEHFYAFAEFVTKIRKKKPAK